MHDFIPPYPDRPSQPLSAIATLRLARRNFLAIWEERCFEWEVFSTRLLSRSLFVCNSPDTVTAAFVERHESFERKSPQMRHSLAPLLGDGLFISDGDTWRRRRPIVAPIVHVSRMPLFAPIMVQAASETAERWARSGQGAPINALTETAALTAEIICRTVFGGHRKFWGKPDHFIPERFLPENAQFRVRHAYVPFSVGPRICAGAAFGLTEAVLCLATLAQRVRLRLMPDAVVAPVCRLTLRPGDDLRMYVENRG
jgi:cytochrome P450